MKASALMFELRNIINKHGDLPIIGASLADDTKLRKLTLTDENGCDATIEGTKPTCIYLT